MKPFTTAALFVLSIHLKAQDFDPAFGSIDGVPIDESSNEEGINCIAIDSQGRIVCVGTSNPNGGMYTALIARLLDNGSLDPTFHGDGMRTWSLGSVDTKVTCLAVADDGSIYFGGSSEYPASYQMTIVHLLENGQLDPSFGVNGVKQMLLGTSSAAGDITILGDGSLLIAGGVTDTITGPDLALFHMFPDGTLDPAFGVGGIVSFGSDTLPYFGFDMIHVPGSNSLLIGLMPNAMIGRFNLDGSLDTTFNNPNGYSLPSPETTNRISIATDTDGNIYVLSSVSNYLWSSAMHLRKFFPDGTPDLTFAGDGDYNTSSLATKLSAKVLVRPNGRVVICAQNVDWSLWTSGGLFIQQLLPSGDLDFDFGTVSYLDFGMQSWTGHGREPMSMAMDSLGRIVVSGWSTSGAGAARIWRILEGSTIGFADLDQAAIDPDLYQDVHGVIHAILPSGSSGRYGVSDLMGRLVLDGSIKQASEVLISMDGHPQGLYTFFWFGLTGSAHAHKFQYRSQ